jgi:hypothetical protein
VLVLPQEKSAEIAAYGAGGRDRFTLVDPGDLVGRVRLRPEFAHANESHRAPPPWSAK